MGEVVSAILECTAECTAIIWVMDITACLLQVLMALLSISTNIRVIITVILDKAALSTADQHSITAKEDLADLLKDQKPTWADRVVHTIHPTDLVQLICHLIWLVQLCLKHTLQVFPRKLVDQSMVPTLKRVLIRTSRFFRMSRKLCLLMRKRVMLFQVCQSKTEEEKKLALLLVDEALGE